MPSECFCCARLRAESLGKIYTLHVDMSAHVGRCPGLVCEAPSDEQLTFAACRLWDVAAFVLTLILAVIPCTAKHINEPTLESVESEALSIPSFSNRHRTNNARTARLGANLTIVISKGLVSCVTYVPNARPASIPLSVITAVITTALGPQSTFLDGRRPSPLHPAPD